MAPVNSDLQQDFAEGLDKLVTDFRARAVVHRRKCSQMSIWILTSIMLGVFVIIFLPPIIVASDMAIRSYFKIPVISDEINRLQDRRIEVLRAEERLSTQLTTTINSVVKALERPFGVSVLNERFSEYIHAQDIVEISGGSHLILGKFGAVLSMAKDSTNSWEVTAVSGWIDQTSDSEIRFVGKISDSTYLVVVDQGDDPVAFTFDQTSPLDWIGFPYRGEVNSSLFQVDGLGVFESNEDGSLAILRLSSEGKVIRKLVGNTNGKILTASKIDDRKVQLIANVQFVSLNIGDEFLFAPSVGSYSYDVFEFSLESETLEEISGFTVDDSNRPADIVVGEGQVKHILFRPGGIGHSRYSMRIYSQEEGVGVWVRSTLPEFEGRSELVELRSIEAFDNGNVLAFGWLANTNIVGDSVILHTNNLNEGFVDVSPRRAATGEPLSLALSAVREFRNGDFWALGSTFGGSMILLNSVVHRNELMQRVRQSTSFSELNEIFSVNDRLVVSRELSQILAPLHPGLVSSPAAIEARLAEDLLAIEASISNLSENFSNQQSLENLVSGVARFAVLGVLLYFLQTLVNRYRYSNRMAAHSESRADVLELFMSLDAEHIEDQANVLAVLNAGFSSEHITEKNLERDDPLSPQRFVNKIVRE